MQTVTEAGEGAWARPPTRDCEKEASDEYLTPKSGRVTCKRGCKEWSEKHRVTLWKLREQKRRQEEEVVEAPEAVTARLCRMPPYR